jgi:class 3 adenylate cyclase
MSDSDNIASMPMSVRIVRQYWLALILLLPSVAFAQNSTDSLVRALAVSKNDTSRVEIMCSIADNLSYSDQTEGLRYSKQALRIARSIGWNRGIFLANSSVGTNFQYSGINDSARIYFKDALEVGERLNDKLMMANAYNAVGMNYQSTGDLPEALRYELKALNLFDELKKDAGTAMCYGNIGVIYRDLKDSSKAVENYLKAVETYRKLKDNYGLAINLTNLGNLYGDSGDPGRALPIQQEALSKAKSEGLTKLVVQNLDNIGNTYKSERQFRTALDYKAQALKLAEESGDEPLTGICAGNLGGLYVAALADTGTALSDIGVSRTEAFTYAESYLNNAIERLRESDNLVKIARFYALRSKLHELKGEGMAALEDFKKGKVLEDSVTSGEVRQKLASLEMDRELQLKDKEIELQRLAVAKKRNERWFFAGGMVALLVVVGFIARERKRTENLLLNILPAKIAQRLKKREHPIADAFGGVSILFIDMVNFTEFTRANDPKETVTTLDDIFTRFDAIAEHRGLEKIKTIGDCYMAVAGLPVAQGDHAIRAAEMALDVKQTMIEYRASKDRKISFRIGIDCGPVVAGVIGSKKFIYDLWGEAVNTASRMESTGVTGEIHCTDNFRTAVGSAYRFTSRGIMDIKGIGPMETWLLQGRA